MAKVYVTEFVRLSYDTRNNATFPEYPPAAEHVLDTAGTTVSPAFNPQTTLIRLVSDGPVSYALGTAPVATTSNNRLPADWVDYVGVAAGSNFKISIIANT
jgi:hypothetical protein